MLTSVYAQPVLDRDGWQIEARFRLANWFPTPHAIYASYSFEALFGGMEEIT